jgi:hypothetical protein
MSKKTEIMTGKGRVKLEKIRDEARKNAKVIDVAAHQRVWYRLSDDDGRRLSVWLRTEKSIMALCRDVYREGATITAEDKQAARSVITLLEDVILNARTRNKK